MWSSETATTDSTANNTPVLLAFLLQVMTVSAPSGMNLVDCPSCAASLVFDSNKRIIVLDATGEERAAAAGASAPAAGAKKKRAPAADE